MIWNGYLVPVIHGSASSQAVILLYLNQPSDSLCQLRHPWHFVDINSVVPSSLDVRDAIRFSTV